MEELGENARRAADLALLADCGLDDIGRAELGDLRALPAPAILRPGAAAR
jgi:hypothetical protein